MDTIKILAICPYEEMRKVITSTASQREGIEVTPLLGDLDEGVAIAKRALSTSHYDFVIARGATARLLSYEADIPVLDIPVLVSDLMLSIKLATGYTGSCAIVGQSSIVDGAKTACEILRYDIESFLVNSNKDIHDCLLALKERDYTLILGGANTCSIAQSLGLNTILITSGYESVNTVFNQAQYLYNHFSIRRRIDSILTKGLAAGPYLFQAMDSSGNIIYSTVAQQDQFSQYIKKFLKSSFPTFFREEQTQTIKKWDNNAFAINTLKQTIDGERFLLCYVNILNYGKKAVPNNFEIINRAEIMRDSYVNYFYNEYSLYNIDEQLCDSGPVLLIGEPDVDYDYLAMFIYEKSHWRNNPCYVFDFTKLTDVQWEDLVNNPLSPLHDNQHFLLFKNIDSITGKCLETLVQLFEFSNICTRNSVIVTCVSRKSGERAPGLARFLESIQRNGVTFQLDPLRNRTGAINNLITLQINELNQKHGPKIMGMDRDAMLFLEEYSWPGNISQLKRVITEAYIKTPGIYIPLEKIKNCLDHALPQYERTHTDTPSSSYMLDTTKSLKDTTRDIAEHVLRQNGGNRVKTAEVLGISRSTLWRILKGD